MEVFDYLLGKKSGGGGEPPVYQDKEITITQNGTQTIQADEGYNALSSVEITTNVGGIDPEDWQRPSDWWDTKTILANEEPITIDGTTAYPVFCVLLADTEPTTNLIIDWAKAYKTSDGGYYESNSITHTWDTTKDKPCSLGYKTRYMIIYFATNVSSFGGTFAGKDYIEIIMKPHQNCTFSAQFNYTGMRQLINFETIYNQYIVNLDAYCFRNCSSLQHVSVPNLIENMGYNIFNQNNALTNIEFANLTTNSMQMIQYCYGIIKAEFPSMTNCGSMLFYDCNVKNIVLNNNVVFNANMFSDTNGYDMLDVSSCTLNVPPVYGIVYSLKNIILPNNYKADGLSLSYASLTRNCILDIINKLADVSSESGTYTLTLGANNLAKITAQELAIGTNKGWTIS